MPNVLRVVECEARSSASKVSAKNSNLGFENPRNIPDGLTEAFVKAPRLGKYNVLLDVLQKSRSNPNSTSDQSAEPSLVFCNSVKSCRAAEHFLANSGFNTCGYHEICLLIFVGARLHCFVTRESILWYAQIWLLEA